MTWYLKQNRNRFMGKRELVALLNVSSRCLVMVEWLFLTVPRGCLRFVIVVFPDHTHSLFYMTCYLQQERKTSDLVSEAREKHVFDMVCETSEKQVYEMVSEAREKQIYDMVWYLMHEGNRSMT